MSDDEQAVNMTGGEAAVSEERERLIERAARYSGFTPERVIDILKSMEGERGDTDIRFEDEGHKMRVYMSQVSGENQVWIDDMQANGTDWEKLQETYQPIIGTYFDLQDLIKGSEIYMRGTVRDLFK